MAFKFTSFRSLFRVPNLGFSYLGFCYPLIFCSLLTFTVLSTQFLYVPSSQQRHAPQRLTLPHVTIKTVSCALPRSGQYGNAPRVINYVLLICTVVVTIVLNEQQGLWLTIGAATSAVLYSSIAALHQILIFHYAVQQHSKPWGEPLCHFKDLGPSYPQLPICYGVDDLDRDTVCSIVGAAMLAALPMTVWSKLMRKGSVTREATKPILLIWVLLMAISHIFCAINSTDQSVHYQICPIGSEENFPGYLHKALKFDDNVFHATLSAMISNSKQSLDGSDIFITPPNHCMYTCFALQQYPLRDNRDIGVWSISTPGLSHLPSPATRSLGVGFWAIYLSFSILAFWDASDSARKYTAKYFSCYMVGCSWKNEAIYPWKTLKDFLKRHGAVQTCLRLIIQVVFHFPRYLSAIMFVGYVIFLEMGHWYVPDSETFGAVGQWSAVVQIGLVLLAALFARAVEHRRSNAVNSVESDMEMVIIQGDGKNKIDQHVRQPFFSHYM
jgi:hypothetical protein